MPKRYSEQERQYIQRRLKDEAKKCLIQYGIRRTTVDEIVRRVKIPKGTFYLFYQSKEMLLFEVILEQHCLIEQKLRQAITGIDPGDISAEKLTDILLGFYQIFSEIPVLNVLNSDEIELLVRKLPHSIWEEHLGHDNAMLENLFALLPIKPGADLNTFTAAFRALYFTTLRKDEIGAEHYDKALRVLIYGLVTQLIET